MTLHYDQTEYAAIVARVSTREQEEKGTSLESQVEECLAKAREDGFSVPEDYTFRDVESGAHWHRAGLESAIQLGREGKIKRIYVHSYDRVSRDPLDMLNILRACEDAGVQLILVTGPSDTSPEGQLMMFILGYTGRRERLQFIERTDRSKKRIAREEGRMATGDGVGLYGTRYDKDLKRRVIIAEEAAVVVWAYNRRLQRISYYGIACELNELGIPSKTGKRWTANAVKRMLTNRAYTGKHPYGRRQVRKVRKGNAYRTEVTFRPDSETIMVHNHTPAIISEEVYEAAQKVAEAPQPKKRNGELHVLTGFAKCLTCGAPLRPAMRAKKITYFRCSRALGSRLRPATCFEKYIRQDELEPAAWELVSESIKDPDILIHEIFPVGEDDDGTQKREIRRLEREVNELERQQSRLMAERGKDHIDEKLLENQIAPVKLLCDEKKEALKTLEEQKEKREQAADAEALIREYCSEIAKSLDNIDKEGKRQVLAAFGVIVEATKKDLVVTMAVDPAVTITSPSSRRWSPLQWASGRV